MKTEPEDFEWMQKECERLLTRRKKRVQEYREMFPNGRSDGY